jgi:prolyl-tRNA editing enzyme YbaK/EbsC (Cys-tRNA(Pro) deacylase)
MQRSDSVERVAEALRGLGVSSPIVAVPESTRTAAEAAAVVGCSVAQIAKSIVLRAKHSDSAVVVVTSGVNRVDERALAVLLGEPVGKADADFVRAKTGFAIGGVAPIAHLEPVRLFFDEALLEFETVWAAAGSPFAIFGIAPQELLRITGARRIDCRPRPPGR